MTELMTNDEIHDFGVEAVANQLRREGYEILAEDRDPANNPQIVARHEGRLHYYILVRTAVFPGKGLVPPTREYLGLLQQSMDDGADLCFTSVGIANAHAKDDDERSVPVRGAGFHIAYNGLEKL